MRRISIILAIALSTLLLISICSAQQTPTATSAGNPANTTKLGSGPDTIINCVGAKNGTIPIWTGSAPPNITLCNSGIYEASPYGTGAIGILNPNPIASLDVTGDINSSKTYEIGGSSVLSIGSPADGNLFLGVGAGSSNVAGSGTANVFSGWQAGNSNTTGYANTFMGGDAGYRNTTGYENTFVGAAAGISNTTGGGNTFVGVDVGIVNTTGGGNTFSGYYTGYYNTTGSGNLFYGVFAGINNKTGNNNIYVGNLGPNSGSESNAIRIGGDIGTGYGPQTVTYIAGIYGATASGGLPVYINSNGQLGTSASSLRFKERVRDMADSTNALMKLRPVTFLYKPEYANGERTLQYGLIAEEVANVYPELVAYDKDGQPYSVRYQYITTMLLNEVQKQYHRAEKQSEVIETQQKQMKAQQQEIESLKQQMQVQNATLQERLSRLEGLVRMEVATAATK